VPESAEALRINLEDAIDSGELSYERAAGATRWADNEIRKLINAISTYGAHGGDGLYHITFGTLCDQAGSAFWGKSLSGTLQTAKAMGVVAFDAATLFVGAHAALDITLLREAFEDSAPKAYTYGQVRQMSARRQRTSASRHTAASMRGRGGGSVRRGFQATFADDVLANMDALDALDAAEEALSVFAEPGPAGRLGSGSGSDSSDMEAVEDVLASLAAQVEETEDMAAVSAGGQGDAHDVALAVPADAPILRKNLRASVRSGGLSAVRAQAATRWMDKEMRKLITAISTHGTKNDTGAVEITFKKLCDAAAGVFWGTALQGALKTAREQGIVLFKGGALMKGVSDKIVITLARDTIANSSTETYTFEQIRQVSLRRGSKPASLRGAPSHSFAHSFRRSIRSRRGLAPPDLNTGSELEKYAHIQLAHTLLASSNPRTAIPTSSLRLSTLICMRHAPPFSLWCHRVLSGLMEATTVLDGLDVHFVEGDQAADVEESLEAEEEAVAQAELAARRQAESSAVTQMFAQARIRAERLAQQRAFAEAEDRRRAALAAEQCAQAATRARLEAETRMRIEAEVRARIEAEAAASRHVAESLALREARLEAQRKAEERSRAEAEADLQVRVAAEMQAKRQHEAMLDAQVQARARAAAAQAAKAEAEILAATAEAARVQADAELHARTDALRAKTSAVAERIRAFQAAQAATKAPRVRVSIRRRKPDRASDRLDDTPERQAAAVDDVLASMTTIHRRSTVKKAAAGAPAAAAASKPAPPTPPFTMASVTAQAVTAVIPAGAAVLSRKLSVSVKKGELTQNRAVAATRWADGVMAKVVQAMKAFGIQNKFGRYEVNFGVLFDATDSLFESLSGSLRTAKNQGIISFKTPMLLKGAHDMEIITLLRDELQESSLDTYDYQQIRQMSSRRKKKPSAREPGPGFSAVAPSAVLSSSGGGGSSGGIKKDASRISARRGGLRKAPLANSAPVKPDASQQTPSEAPISAALQPVTIAAASKPALEAAASGLSSPWKSKGRSRVTSTRASKRQVTTFH